MSVLSLAQATVYAQDAGFAGRALDLILAIAQAESGLDTTARNTNTDGSVDRGILQINNKYHPEYSDAQCDDPTEAFKAGFVISHSGTDFSPWSTFNNGAYRQYLPAISALLPNAEHFSEFQGGYHGTCGETALATALTCAGNQTDTAAGAIALMLAMTKEMIALGWASSNGSTTTAHLHDEAHRRGYATDDAHYIPFANQIDPNLLHNILLQFAGVKPIILEIARAYALPGDEAGVQYHFICVVGVSPTGYICNDGDNSAISQHLVTYSWAQIEAASPCGVLLIDPLQGPLGVPAGWTDDGSILTAPNGHTAQHAFRSYILNHPNWDPLLMPIGQDYAVAGGDRHAFTYALEWDRATGQTKAVEGPDAPPSPSLDPSIKTDLEAAVATLQASVASALARLP